MHGTQRDGALDALHRGFAVLPLEPHGKRPYGALAPRGVKSATRDRSTVVTWFMTRADLNFGIATGAGLVVLDLDGEEALDRVQQLGLPRTLTVRTARGLHAYFEWLGPSRNTTGLLGKGSGVDLRAAGGYVVGPGSVHPSGAIYVLEDDLALSGPPDWLIEVMLSGGHAAKKAHRAARLRPDDSVDPPVSLENLPRGIRALLSDVSDGRNARVYEVVRALVGLGADDEVIVRTVMASPLGGKAKESGNPVAYLRQKIDSARAWARELEPPPTPNEFLAALRCSGLRGNRKRLLELMASSANDRSLVVMGVRDAALGAALPVSTARWNLQAAVRDGWLRIAFRPPRGTTRKTVYELAVPRGHTLPSGSCPRPRAGTTAPCGQDVSTPALPLDHDAFRDSRTSVAFPTLAALSTNETRSNALLAAMTGVTTRTIRRHLVRLRADGLALPDVDGHRRVRDLEDALHECARRRGVEGIGAQERRRIQDERRARRRAQAEYREEERMRATKEEATMESPITLDARPVATDVGGHS